MLLRVIATQNERVRECFLREVYEWFLHKQNAMGDLSEVEKEQEIKLLNPQIDSLAGAVRKIIDQKVKSHLCNEEEQFKL